MNLATTRAEEVPEKRPIQGSGTGRGYGGPKTTINIDVAGSNGVEL